MNIGSPPDGRSYILYRVLTLTTQIYTESLLNDGSAPDDRSYSLYCVLTLTTQIYTESTWITEAFLTVALTAYI